MFISYEVFPDKSQDLGTKSRDTVPQPLPAMNIAGQTQISDLFALKFTKARDDRYISYLVSL